ncbi:MAG: Z1 domain-containing protein, partial [Planctomycetaceae bacterium]|nr:Z1 domain-containing protein [Planctomycetaceae bacterium]
PSRVFGLDGDPDTGIESRPELPLVRLVNDHEAVFPAKHKKDLHIAVLPDSLRLALYNFILVCAARRARGQTAVHNSMLVHVTRFVDVQHQVAEKLQNLVDSIRRRITMGEGDRHPTLESELERIWREDFEPTSEDVQDCSPDENLIKVTWSEVSKELGEAAARIEVKEINGHATDALDYVAHRQGFNVVAVGGDKLSRGLTLEGLSVSYFLRASQMYDTLMQMGRWFGYRPGYLDLCRLFTTEDLRRWYRHIALAEVELRREFDRMKEAGLTPRRYGLRIRQHPGGLLVTAMNKMSHSQTQRLSYAGQLVQTAHFSTSAEVTSSNKRAVERFLSLLGQRKKVPRAWLWTDVSADRIVDDLLADYSVAAETWRFQRPEMIEFIRRQNSKGQLANWTVALVDTANGSSFAIADCDVGLAERSPESGTWEDDAIPAIYQTRNANIQSPDHQALDLAEMVLDQSLLDHLLAKRIDEHGDCLFDADESDLLRRCLEEKVTLQDIAERLTKHRKITRSPGVNTSGSRFNGLVVRNLRPSSNGLLLIYPIVPKEREWPLNREPFMGLAFSFPSSHTAMAVEYRVNRVWQDAFQDSDYANDDE